MFPPPGRTGAYCECSGPRAHQAGGDKGGKLAHGIARYYVCTKEEMKRLLICAIWIAALALPSEARKRDPLNDLEVEQLREATDQPNKRIKLMLQFTRARMSAIDQLRADPKLAAGRGKEIHGLLEDFTTLAEELEDN